MLLRLLQTLQARKKLKVLNEDIRFIKQNNVTLSPKGDFFFGSLTYWLLLFDTGYCIHYILYHLS